jgi:3-oxoacyl-[acyl-carrier protein] reductase
VLSNALRTGIWGLVKTLARELGPDQILVNLVAPGRIQTERIEELDQAAATRRGVDLQQVKRDSVGSIPLGRLGTPEEFANLLVFLASDAGRYISGQAIIVDGAATAAL